jgi:hypothetical protein
MRKGRTTLCVAAAALCLLAAGCKKTKINPNDSTPPTVTIKVRGQNGQYAVADQAPLKLNGSESLEFICQVEDPEGVKFVGYAYSGGINSCTIGSTVFNGNFQVQPLPPPASQSLSGDANQEVVTSLPLLSNPDLQGPFTCNVPANGTGSPFGGKITVTCTGRNWSSNNAVSEAKKTLTVNLQQ